MAHIRQRALETALFLSIIVLIPVTAFAQLVVKDNFTGAKSSFGWNPLGGACLTAGGGTLPDDTPASAGSTIPGCQNLDYYNNTIQVGGVTGRLPDVVGKGALRLTNGDTAFGGGNGNNATGSIVSSGVPFPTNQGVHITYTTATYGGNGYGTGTNPSIPAGADGLAFFLLDGSFSPSIGAYGGSLGYSCAQGKNPADGVIGGYLAVAADEYGNFSNKGDSTSDGVGPNPGSIVVRGAGSIAWVSLNKIYPIYYPSSLSLSDQLAVVQDTCRNGTVQNYSGSTINDPGGATTTKHGKTTPLPINDRGSTTLAIADYNLIGIYSLAALQKSTTPVTIFSQEATSTDPNVTATNFPMRGSATKIAYDLTISQDGLLSFAFSLSGGNFTSVIDKLKIPNLPNNFRFGFTSGTGGGSNVHEILCFKATQTDIAADSIGSNVQQSSKIQAGSQVYFAYFHPKNSWGQLQASSLAIDASGTPIINPISNWDASCVLTGGLCPATGVPVVAEPPAVRNIFSWSGTNPITFAYASLSSAEQVAIGGTTDGTKRIAYLRGERTNEATATPAGPYRGRDGILGDIRNSSPAWVGYPYSPYSTVAIDRINPSDLMPEFGAIYNSFASVNATRGNVVYVGANDGMLHGFRAGAYDNKLVFDPAVANDGKEILAYVPGAAVSSIHNSSILNLDFSSPSYAHNAFVDATPATGDLYYGNAWHTWLVGGLGAGGNPGGIIGATSPADLAATANGVVFALDVTDPTKFTETAANAATVVQGEWNSSNIVCSNDLTCKDKLGSIYGTPVIKRMHNGNWAAIFGNGRNSANGAAGVFIMLVDATGAKSFVYLDTKASNASDKNGIDFVTAADLDGDQVTDYLYAGDLKGNVWRFDVTSSDPSKWASGGTAMFSTPSGQPITSSITYTLNPSSGGKPRVIVQFGTGRQTPQTGSSATAYAGGTQALYGVWDWDMTDWNSKKSTQFLNLTGPQTYSVADLTEQFISNYGTSQSTDADIGGYRTVTQTAICWKDQTACAVNTKFGWKINFTGSEQIIYNPQVVNGLFFVNTTIPGALDTASCSDIKASGYSMVISPDSGGAPTLSVFDTVLADAHVSVLPSSGIVAGVGFGATGTTTVLSDNTAVFQTSSGTPERKKLDCKAMGTCVAPAVPAVTSEAHRVTWTKLR